MSQDKSTESMEGTTGVADPKFVYSSLGGRTPKNIKDGDWTDS